MISVFIGSLALSLLHAVIPNHWLPLLAIGRKEGWGLGEVLRVTFVAGLAHAFSTVLIGVLLSLIGHELAVHIDDFTHIIGPVILVLLGLYFVQQHYRHHHFHLHKTSIGKKSKAAVVAALIIAMFLSPCMEIEAYFLLAGTKGWYFLAAIALMYTIITVTGMLIWVRIAYKGVLKLNWHQWEHNAGIITGVVLIVTGIVSFFIS